MEVFNLLTTNQFLQSSSKSLQKSSIISPKILTNVSKFRFSISLHVRRNCVRSEPCFATGPWTCFRLGIFTMVRLWLESGVRPIIFLLSSCLPACPGLRCPRRVSAGCSATRGMHGAHAISCAGAGHCLAWRGADGPSLRLHFLHFPLRPRPSIKIDSSTLV